MNKKILIITVSVIIVLGIAASIIIPMAVCDDSSTENASLGDEIVPLNKDANSVEDVAKIMEESYNECDYDKFLTLIADYYVKHLENDEHTARLFKQDFEEYAKRLKSYSCVVAEKKRATDSELREKENEIENTCAEDFGFKYDAKLSDGYHVLLKITSEWNTGEETSVVEDNVFIFESDGKWYWTE